jgi:hypothetical protein
VQGSGTQTNEVVKDDAADEFARENADEGIQELMIRS